MNDKGSEEFGSFSSAGNKPLSICRGGVLF